MFIYLEIKTNLRKIPKPKKVFRFRKEKVDYGIYKAHTLLRKIVLPCARNEANRVRRRWKPLCVPMK